MPDDLCVQCAHCMKKRLARIRELTKQMKERPSTMDEGDFEDLLEIDTLVHPYGDQHP